MADESNQQQPAPSGVQDLGGAARVTPGTTDENKGPTLEEQAAEQDRKAKEAEDGGKAGAETKEKPAEGQSQEGDHKAETDEAGDKPKTEEAGDKPAPFDFKGTVFEGMSEEMQGKIAPYAAAFEANGTLTEAEVSEAAKATGFSEQAIQQFIAGGKAEAVVAAKPIFDTFGGQEQFNEFQTWSKQEGSLSASEERTINKAIASGDYETAAELMKGPMARWRESGEGPAPRDVTREGGGGLGGDNNSADVYGSWAEVTADQGKPEYRSNPTFRKSVEQKIARSPLS